MSQSIQKPTVTVMKGDGIGPEVVDSAIKVLNAAGVELNYEECVAGKKAFEAGVTTGVPQETLDSIERNKLVLKGPLETPIGHGGKSANVTIRKLFEMYGNVRPIKDWPGVATPFSGRCIDMTIVRENVEDLYAGIEYLQTPDVAQCLKLITRAGCERIVRLAFEIAVAEGRSSVHCVHKANIMKMTEGMLKRVFEDISSDYPSIEPKQMIVDNCAHQLVIAPEAFEVLVSTNMNGDILSDQGAGLVGGLGLAASANYGADVCMFESVHGSAPDIAGQGKANPLAFIGATLMLLRHIGEFEKATLIEQALWKTLSEDKKTGDLRPLQPALSTSQFTDAIIANLGQRYTQDTGEERAYKPLKVPALKPTPTVAKKELIGLDVFIATDLAAAELAKDLEQRVAGSAVYLKMISSRGTAVYPKAGGSVQGSGFLRCRFLANEGVLSEQAVMELFCVLQEYQWSQLEKLYLFDGVPAFTLAQGEEKLELKGVKAA